STDDNHLMGCNIAPSTRRRGVHVACKELSLGLEDIRRESGGVNLRALKIRSELDLEWHLWDPQRHTLVAEIDGDLSLPSVVFAMLSSESSWEAVVDYCEEVISQKEAAERMGEEAVNAHPLRRRRGER
ncbi:jg27982, partial [Pararge aegeria aegeria]